MGALRSAINKGNTANTQIAGTNLPLIGSTTPYIQQAQSQARVQYQPQYDALGQLLSQAQSVYHVSLNQAHGAKLGIDQSVKNVTPLVRGAYNVGTASAAQAGKFAAHSLNQLSPVADPFKAAAIGEQQSFTNRMAGERAGALTDLAHERVRAAEAEAQQRNQALTTFNYDRQQIAQKLVSLAGERGTYTTSALNELLNAARRDAITLQAQQLNYKASLAKANATVTAAQVAAASRIGAAKIGAQSAGNVAGINAASRKAVANAKAAAKAAAQPTPESVISNAGLGSAFGYSNPFGP